MRKITLLIVHCSATAEGKDYGAADIDRWHRQKGWSQIGYHYIVRLDGTVERGRPESVVGAHCRNHNRHSISICYVGGLSRDGKPADTHTPAQRTALLDLLKSLHVRYPRAVIVGHNTFTRKPCPCFDATAEYAALQP